MVPAGTGQRTLGQIRTPHRQRSQCQFHLRVLAGARRATGGRSRQCIDLRIETEGIATGNPQQVAHMPHALGEHRHALGQIGDAGAQLVGLEGMRRIFLAQRGLPEHVVAHAIERRMRSCAIMSRRSAVAIRSQSLAPVSSSESTSLARSSVCSASVLWPR